MTAPTSISLIRWSTESACVQPRTRLAPQQKRALTTWIHIRDFIFRDGILLGEGGFGRVYCLRLKSTGRKIVTKFIKDEDTFKREIAIMGRLGDAAVDELSPAFGVPMLGCFEQTFSENLPPYAIVMPVYKMSMQDVIENLEDQGKSISPTLMYKWAAQLWRSSYMHKHGVIHRDIKPANILVDDDFNVFIADFGCGYLYAKEDDAAEYSMSQARGRCSRHIDIWSLGVTLCIMAGFYPFDSMFYSEDGEVDMAALTSGTPKIPRYVTREFGAEFEELIRKLLHRSSEARPSASEIRRLSYFDRISVTTWEWLTAPFADAEHLLEIVVTENEKRTWEDDDHFAAEETAQAAEPDPEAELVTRSLSRSSSCTSFVTAHEWSELDEDQLSRARSWEDDDDDVDDSEVETPLALPVTADDVVISPSSWMIKTTRRRWCQYPGLYRSKFDARSQYIAGPPAVALLYLD
ncbi:kinase-like domain-containing protein [Auriculariales sp. MPI-PUGE-AT-0066]|nr:kinase-like domain-containing protein [Auriculariales sp. MPI-PUGE-AT-0066]